LKDLKRKFTIQADQPEARQAGTECPYYERLGFKSNLGYGPRSELRDACSKFLRFSFLLDYIALESLSKICLSSIEDCMRILEAQVQRQMDYELVPYTGL